MPVLLRADGPVARLTLNRPQKRNALSLELMEELILRLQRLGEDPDVRVIVIAAVGPAFSGFEPADRGAWQGSCTPRSTSTNTGPTTSQGPSWR
ncbi:1,4-dihydroxy-2-naphthoyl-CoA synthase [Mycobacterium heckeshornense]|uniref:enoyl-CoA hydratase-related protein n=1 Tax=Mycobacterium heckeshornense TaxID=110505 RepID=UPI0019445455|nr:enoyl-CoA hydratase-related protein [Mycobacterium heckeshornense]BCQ10008.1 1,4-dihydroxy-2-naphthoyl-CoA synthase [Mycobacterium heckeshornense]